MKAPPPPKEPEKKGKGKGKKDVKKDSKLVSDSEPMNTEPESPLPVQKVVEQPR